MEHAQLNEAGTEALQITTHGNVAWDENNYCTAAALVKDGKAEQFRVVPLLETQPPEIDPATQTVFRDGCELIDGQWQYKWTVRDLTPEEIAVHQASQIAALTKSITDATQARLDTFAKTRNYDGILSACTYVSSTITKFATEGQYCANARDATWAALYTIMSEVEQGQRPLPASYEDIEPELPQLVWPT